MIVNGCSSGSSINSVQQISPPGSWVNAAGGDRRLSDRTRRSDKTRLVLPPATRLVVDLIGSSPNVLLFVKRPDGRYLEVNDTFVRRMRCADRSELIGKTVDDFFPPDLAAAYRAEDQALLKSGRPRKNQLEVITDVDGRREWFLSRAFSTARRVRTR